MPIGRTVGISPNGPNVNLCIYIYLHVCNVGMYSCMYECIYVGTHRHTYELGFILRFVDCSFVDCSYVFLGIT